MKNTNKVVVIISFLVVIGLAVFPFTACSKSASNDGGEKILKSPKEVKSYLNKQASAGPLTPIKVSIDADADMLPKLVEAINSSKAEYVSLNLIGTALTNIPSETFKGCKIYSINLPESVTSIKNSAFEDCQTLNNINIPSSVISIGDKAFYGCQSLKSLTISNGVTSIGVSAFQGCVSLSTVTIPESVIFLRDYAFFDCMSLESITFALGTNIKDDNFGNNVVPETVFTRGKNTLKKAYSKQKEGTYEFDSIDGWRIPRRYIGFNY